MHGYDPTAFQQSIYMTLTSDAPLMALLEGVYGFVPEHTEYPYLVIQIDEVRPYNTSVVAGSEMEFSVMCYSQVPSRSECYAVLQKAYEILHEGSASITGYALVNMRFQDSQFDLMTDGITTRGVIRFRAVIQKN